MTIPPEITTIVFDWGDTLMAMDERYSGVMAEWPEVRAVAGAPESLAALQDRFRLAVATNASDSSAAQVRAALARVGLDECITDIFTFRELNTRKPDPLFFQRVAQQLSALPQQLLMVGDNYRVDIPGARRAGWRAAWYNPTGKPAPGPAPLHDLEFAHLADLPSALERADLPDMLTCQAWYLEQGGAGSLWQHVEAVGMAAYHLAILLRAAGHPVDPLLAHRGGLLHDIAKVSARHTGANHGEMGAEILNRLEQPALAEISRRHMLFYLLDEHKRPQTWEQKIVHYADKICEGPRLVEWSERLLGLAERYPHQIEAMRACTPVVMALQAELAQAAGFASAEMLPRLQAAINS